ncbi:MAG: hypothetical protein OEV95_01830 [Gemmatimonadota bacterium]|nr:hypothetical protein [Gemmatimonadota bacterium]
MRVASKYTPPDAWYITPTATPCCTMPSTVYSTSPPLMRPVSLPSGACERVSVTVAPFRFCTDQLPL